jgi:hypothetical protein
MVGIEMRITTRDKEFTVRCMQYAGEGGGGGLYGRCLQED